MATLISLLRGINVGAQNLIRMPDLKKMYEGLGLANVVPYVQSGNVIFECAGPDVAQIAEIIETGITRTFDLAVRVLIRTPQQFETLVGGNPFLNQRHADPAKLHVTFLSEAPTDETLSSLTVSGDSVDEFFVSGEEVYLFCPNGYGKTKLSNTFFEHKLKVSATTRNWKTVTTLYDLATRWTSAI